MEGLRFVKSLLGWLSGARHFNRLMAITLRVTAALIVPLSLVTFFKAGKTIFDLPASGILGGVIFQILFVLAVYGVVHVLLIRAREIEQLPETRYHMFPLASVLLRAAGEAMTVFVAGIAIGGGVYVWFTGKAVSTLFNPPSRFLPVFGDTTFMGGIEFMAGGLLSAVLLLGLSYLLSQALGLIGEIAARRDEKQEMRAAPVADNHPAAYRLRSGTDD